MAFFWKTSEVVKEEARLADLKALFNAGKLSVSDYINAINQLKGVSEGKSSSGPNALDIIQLVLILALVGSGVYVLRFIRKA